MGERDARDLACLRHAIGLADAAQRDGARPFGAIVVDATGAIVAEARAVEAKNPRDWTAHSEMTALRQASAILTWDELADCTIYASSEPCPMCAGALYWCNLSRLVFGASEPAMRDLRAGHPRAAGIALRASDVLDKAPRKIEVVGPLLEDDALAAHRRFWASAPKDA